MQEGALALVEKIESYTKIELENRHALWPYLEKGIRASVAAAMRNLLLGTTVTHNSGPETNHIG